ncbi:MAG: DUF3617 domain-containing protein [Terriglobales bacterium]|jgi:hypothetical protein
MRPATVVGLLVFSLLVLSPIVSHAQGKFTPPDLKEGLWEVTVTRSGSGAGMGGIPPDVLAKMSPDQRAQVEAAMKSHGVTMNGNSTTVKNCVTKEKLAKGRAFSAQNRENCTRDVVSSSPRHMEIKMHCDQTDNGKKTAMDGTTTIDVLGPDSVKGTMHIVSAGDEHNVTMDSTFTSKYLGPDCGDIK